MLGNQPTEQIAEVWAERISCPRWFQSEHTAARRWNAYGTAAIVGVRHRYKARSSGGGRSATHSAGRSCRVPWIARRAEKLWLSRRKNSKLRRVGFRDDNQPGTFVSLDQFAISVGDEIFQVARARGH